MDDRVYEGLLVRERLCADLNDSFGGERVFVLSYTMLFSGLADNSRR